MSQITRASLRLALCLALVLTTVGGISAAPAADVSPTAGFYEGFHSTNDWTLCTGSSGGISCTGTSFALTCSGGVGCSDTAYRAVPSLPALTGAVTIEIGLRHKGSDLMVSLKQSPRSCGQPAGDAIWRLYLSQPPIGSPQGRLTVGSSQTGLDARYDGAYCVYKFEKSATNDWRIYEYDRLIGEMSSAPLNGQIQFLDLYLALNSPGGIAEIDYISIDDATTPRLPDLELANLLVFPESPEAAQETTVRVDIRNRGTAPTDPAHSQARLQISAIDSGTGDIWRYSFHEDIGEMPVGSAARYTIDNFLFVNDRIDRVEGRLFYDGAELDTVNNTTSEPITVRPASEALRSCLMVALDTLLIGLDIYTAGAVNGIQMMLEVTAVVLEVYNLLESCYTGPESFDCGYEFGVLLVKAALSFVEDAPIVGAIYDMMTTLVEAYQCGEHLGVVLRAMDEESNRQGYDINLVSTRSPVHVHIVDAQGRRAGYLPDGTLVNEIPDARVSEKDGHELILFRGTTPPEVVIHGAETGEFGLLALLRSGECVETIEYEAVSVEAATSASLHGTEGAYLLSLDDNGDGQTDRALVPDTFERTSLAPVYLPLLISTQPTIAPAP